MPSQPSSEEAQPILETIVQQAQAAAAAAAQFDSAEDTTGERSLQKADLVSADADADDDESPPPAYGDLYGEPRDEGTGTGTSVSVTDDGRVNIRINQLNRRFSQVFSPARQQDVGSGEYSQRPLPNVSPSSSSRTDEGVALPPPLNIVMQVVGSREDVQPFVALGKVLKEIYGHRVRLATHPVFMDFVQENGLEFFSIGCDPSRLTAFMKKNPGLRNLLGANVGQRRKDISEYIQGCWRSCYEAGDGMGLPATDNDLSELSANEDGLEPATRHFVADCIIANPPSYAHVHCAEKLGIPVHIMFTMPCSPTQAFPHPLANIQSYNADPQLTNHLSYAMIELLSWQGLADVINRFRARCLGLDPVSLIWGPGMIHRLKIPHTYCWSPALLPKPKDWGSHVSVSGYHFITSDYTPTPDLQAFLDAGPPPIYIRFGSSIVNDRNVLTKLIFEVLRKTRQRALLSESCRDIITDIPDGAFMLGNAPCERLFRYVSCVIHHGDPETTAAGLASGRPTIVIPFFGDQPFWGATIARAGAGPEPIPYKQLTADKLASAINFCLKPETLERAGELARKIAKERGSDVSAQHFHQNLEVDRLRCILASSRTATWRIKRTQMKLSAFAACTLANANLLDFSDLKLFRPQEYYTDEGPWEPVSGAFAAALGAVSDMTRGLLDIPTETANALYMPFRGPQQQSQTPSSEGAINKERSFSERRSTLPALPDQSQDTLSLAQSSTALSDHSSRVSDDTRSSFSDASRQRSYPSEANSSKDQIRGRQSLKKDYDILRPTGPHTSKGAGRFMKALVQGPMDISVSLVKGMHNVPKMWGDETVRPQERVSDFKSGVRAVGREFGFGFYDGITGILTQPWQGARRDGAGGLVKGIGKGIGGLFTKPGAAALGVPAYIMKGVHKEVQKKFGRNVQSYIIASRTAQGYEEWLQSSDAEKQDVIDRWKLVHKYVKKKKRTCDKVMRDVLDVQRRQNSEHIEGQSRGEGTLTPARSINSTHISRPDIPELDGAGYFGTIDTLPDTAGPNREPLQSDQVTALGNLENTESMQSVVSPIQRTQPALRQTIATDESVIERQSSGPMRQETQIQAITEQTPRSQNQSSSESELNSDISLNSESDIVLNDEEDEEFEQARRNVDTTKEKVPAQIEVSSQVQQPPSYHSGHLAGTTQSEFEAQQRTGRQNEKTAQEKTEEEIVLEYVKKQSLLELHYQQKGKGRASAIDDEDDEDLQTALKLSMQDHERQVGYEHGEGSSRASGGD